MTSTMVVVVAVAAVAAAVAVVEKRDGFQWWRWWGCLMAAAALVATFNGGGIGQQQGIGELQMQQSNEVMTAAGGDFGCRRLTVTIGDSTGWFQQWRAMTQQATKYADHKKATMVCGGGCSDNNNSEERVVVEDDGDG